MEDLIRGIKENKEDAFELVYKLKREKVLAFFYKKTTSLEDAKDLMQNVFFRLWKYRHTIDETKTVDQHLFRLAKHVFIDYLRRKKKTRTEVLTPLHTDPAAIYTDYPSLEKEAVLTHLKSEAPLNQQIFLLNKFYGYTYQQIARLLSMPVKSVDNYLNKTLKRLRKKM